MNLLVTEHLKEAENILNREVYPVEHQTAIYLKGILHALVGILKNDR